MMKLATDAFFVLSAVLVVSLAVWKWHIIRDHHIILSTIGIALKKRSAFWIGILAGVFYIAVFLLLGGKGGRVHVLFGRLVFNTTAGDVLAGIGLAFLVMISMSLFVRAIQTVGLRGSGKESGVGLAGTFLAVLAAFCP